MCVFPGDDQRGGVALHCHPGPASQHLCRLLADGLGAGGQRHRHGYCRGGTHTHMHTHGKRRCGYFSAADSWRLSVCEKQDDSERECVCYCVFVCVCVRAQAVHIYSLIPFFSFSPSNYQSILFLQSSTSPPSRRVAGPRVTATGPNWAPSTTQPLTASSR